MTNRQKALGVTEYGYKRGITDNEFLTSNEAFLAKIATVKKGQYHGIDIIEKWFGIKSYVKLEEMKPFLSGLTVIMPEHFYYTDTNGLDLLTIR